MKMKFKQIEGKDKDEDKGTDKDEYEGELKKLHMYGHYHDFKH